MTHFAELIPNSNASEQQVVKTSMIERDNVEEPPHSFSFFGLALCWLAGICLLFSRFREMVFANRNLLAVVGFLTGGFAWMFFIQPFFVGWLLLMTSFAFAVYGGWASVHRRQLLLTQSRLAESAES